MEFPAVPKNKRQIPSLTKVLAESSGEPCLHGIAIYIISFLIFGDIIITLENIMCVGYIVKITLLLLLL